MTHWDPLQLIIRLGTGAVVTALAALVVLLGYQKGELRKELGKLRQIELGLPYVGRVVPSFFADAVTTDTTRPVLIGGSGTGRAQLVFFLQSTCPHCERTLPYWNSITQEIKSEGLAADVFGLSKELRAEIQRYVRGSTPAFPVASFPDERTAELYGAVGAPITVVLDSDGRIAFARLGALTSRRAADSVITAVQQASASPAAVLSSSPSRRHP